MSLKFSLFKTPKPKGFNYKPLYYNPEKEDLMQRVKEAQQNSDEQKAGDLGLRKIRISQSFSKRKMQTGHLNLLQNQAKKQRMRIILIASVLFALFYFWLKS